MKRWSERVLYVIPFCLFVVTVLLSNAQGPYYLGNNVEDYPYLLNALNLLTFHTPAHVDHPGTTLQTLGAVVIAGRWLLAIVVGPWESIQKSVLGKPEDYLHAINLVILLGLALTAYYAGRHIHRVSGSLTAALTLQGGWFLFLPALLSTERVQNEPLLMIAGLLLSMPLTTWVFERRTGEGSPASMKPASACGAILAFGVVSKITFIPAVLFVLLFFRSLRERVTVFVAMLCTGAILLLPIYSELSRMSSWFLSLATHTGRYGSGPAGLTASSQFGESTRSLFHFGPLLFWLVPYYCLVLAANKWELRGEAIQPLTAEIRRLGWTSVAGVGIAIFMIASKQSPEARYLVPAMVLSVIASASVTLLFANWKARSILKYALAGIGLILAVAGLSSTGQNLLAWTRSSAQYQQSLAAMGLSSGLGLKIDGMDGCKVISFYRSSVPTYGLFFGNDFSAGAQSATLAELYPDAMQFNIFNGQLLRFARPVSPSEIRQALAGGQCFLLEGTRGMESHFTALSGLTMKAVKEGLGWENGEGVYRLDLSAAYRPLQGELKTPAGSLIVEAENFSAGNVEREFKIWGSGIGVIVSPHYPAYAEYAVSLKPGKYTIWLRYAAAESRPLTVSVNGAVISSDGAQEVTNGWQPTDQMWQAVGVADMNASNVIRLERALPFPHVDKIAFVPVEAVKAGN